MVTKPQRDSLASELSAIDALLAQLDEDDFVSRQSLSYKRQELHSDLDRLSRDVRSQASVVLAFEGGPVQGTRGIDASFAARTIDNYQSLINKQVASQDVQLARTGPVPFRNSARMQITDVVHGSFGFQLEEVGGDQLAMFNSPVQSAITQVNDVIATFAGGSDEAYRSTLANVDRRVFISMQSFFESMYRDSAALKISESDRDLVLSQYDILRARERVAGVEVVDLDLEIAGELLGLTPISRRFDLRITQSDTLEPERIISGQVGQKLSTDYLERLHGEVRLPGHVYDASITYRTATRADGTISESFTLVDLKSGSTLS